MSSSTHDELDGMPPPMHRIKVNYKVEPQLRG